MSPKFIGYELNGIVYDIATHLGGIYASENEANIYFDENKLNQDFIKAKKVLCTSINKLDNDEFILTCAKSTDRDFRGGRLFISSVFSNRCEFCFFPKENKNDIYPTDGTNSVSLRTPFIKQKGKNSSELFRKL